ncbi:uncharacterized protein LOC110924929 [Helianthus annuus]|uniref:uncharacterized protein LOC110924929 n=1 Tax=Helianthus annuus TaxID=4232 RepID=UPI0016531243|nr:uncharacterized protein LOC110924929 [Helianthus annuus]
MSESGSPREVNQVPNTSTPGASQAHATTPASFSTPGARIWFNDLPARSIRSFDDLSKGFLTNFSQQRRYVKDATVIFQIKQRDDESLREFIERYKKEGLTYVGADEKMRVAGFMNAVTSKYLTRDFNKSLPKTLEEALERAEAAHI